MRAILSILYGLAAANFMLPSQPALATGDLVLAQADSEGGSISGGDIKAVPSPSKTPTRRAAPRPAAAEAPARRAPPNREIYDGAWSVTSTTTPTGSCSGTNTGQVTISSGRVLAGGAAVGTVSPSGAVNTTTSYSNGITSVARGQIHGHAAGGTYRMSNGCTGRWTAIKL